MSQKNYPALEDIKSDYAKITELIKNINTKEAAAMFELSHKYFMGNVFINGYDLNEFCNGIFIAEGERDIEGKKINPIHKRSSHKGRNEEIGLITYERYGVLRDIKVYLKKGEISDITFSVINEEGFVFVENRHIFELTEGFYKEQIKRALKWQNEP